MKLKKGNIFCVLCFWCLLIGECDSLLVESLYCRNKDGRKLIILFWCDEYRDGLLLVFLIFHFLFFFINVDRWIRLEKIYMIQFSQVIHWLPSFSLLNHIMSVTLAEMSWFYVSDLLAAWLNSDLEGFKLLLLNITCNDLRAFVGYMLYWIT